jgi:hypothetical protein
MQLIPSVWGDDQEPDVEDAFGDHDIEYWVWRGNKLVPATDEQVALLREREALARLARLTDTDALALEQTWHRRADQPAAPAAATAWRQAGCRAWRTPEGSAGLVGGASDAVTRRWPWRARRR